MNFILKSRWFVLLVWLIAVPVLMLTAPNMEQLVRDKGQIAVPDGYTSTQAARLQDEINKQKGGAKALSAVLVFHNAKGLTAQDKDEIHRGLDSLKAAKQDKGIASVTDSYDQPELEKQLVSKDGKTMLALVSVDKNGRLPSEMSRDLYEPLKDVNVEHYYTGSWMIDEDVVVSSQEGLKKTEGITVVFILVILLLVFRSAVAPFIPLITVGMAYVASQSVVAFLVDRFDFPLSNFTQIFMVAVLFGIGTDYCILLISRFKEELAARGNKREAILATYRTAGRTVLFSGLAVLVGFASIGMSTFILYRSAVAVAVGVAVLLVALFTIVPFFMAVLGKALFWPTRKTLEHPESKLWGLAGSFSLKRPLLALALVLLICLPFLVAYKHSISFNSLDELGDKYNSVKAFNIISDSFGPGESLPASIVLKSDKTLDNSKDLAIIEEISRQVAKVDGVKTVRTVTRPTGELISDFQVAGQVGTLGNGLGQGADGIGKIKNGLADAQKELTSSEPKLKEAAGGAQQLVSGTNDLKTGVVQLNDGLKRIEQGLKDGSAGAAQLSDGLKQAKASADKLAAANHELLGLYQEMSSGLKQLRDGYTGIESKLAELGKGLDTAQASLQSLSDRKPELRQDADFLKAQGAIKQVSDGLTQLDQGIKQLNANLSKLFDGLNQANYGLAQATEGQQSLADGLASLVDGIDRLQQGIQQSADGQGQIVGKMPAMIDGLDRLADGQKQLAAGYEQFGGQLSDLTGGLGQSVDGLSNVSQGLQSAQDYLKQLSSAPDKSASGFYIPDQALNNADFQKAMDAYMSKDRKYVTFDVVFQGNPYDSKTLGVTDEIDAAVKRTIKGTDLQGSETAIGGVTSISNDLDHISAADYKRTVVLMLAGIAVILIILLRSIVMPIYLILSLILTYYTGMAIAEVIFVRWLGYAGISWAVPFFAFVLLVALGVDYSIFLMDRFKERRHLPTSEALLYAMRNMGTVILSAAVILGGTFAAMLPSGVMSLLQIATIVLSGLALYALVVLPFFIPVMVRMFGPANWWPFMGQRSKSDDKSPSPQLPKGFSGLADRKLEV